MTKEKTLIQLWKLVIDQMNCKMVVSPTSLNMTTTEPNHAEDVLIPKMKMKEFWLLKLEKIQYRFTVPLKHVATFALWICFSSVGI